MPQIVDEHRTQLAYDGNLAQSIYKTAVLATSASEYILIVAPGGGDTIITGAKYEAFGGGAQVSLFVAPTVTANGTAANKAFYSLRNINTPSLGIYYGPTVTDEGTLGGTFKLFGTTSAVSAGTSKVSEDAVRPLVAGSQYLVKLEAIDNNVEIQMFLEWAEL